MSAAYYKIDDELLKRNLIDEDMIKEILRRASTQKDSNWRFTSKDVQVDILSKNSYKIEFFASRNESKYSSQERPNCKISGNGNSN